MRGDIPEAAFRLSCVLTVHTHERDYTAYAERLSANNLRAVKIGRVTYESLTEAGRQLGFSRGKVRLMIDKGQAEYV